MSIGTGEHPKKYSPGKTSFKYSRHFRPTELKPGMIVELGGLNIFDGEGYSHPQVVVGNETLLVISEKDVAIVCE